MQCNHQLWEQKPWSAAFTNAHGLIPFDQGRVQKSQPVSSSLNAKTERDVFPELSKPAKVGSLLLATLISTLGV